MPITIPHIFQDNVAETASGVQVNQNFAALKTPLETVQTELAALQAKLAAEVSALTVGSGLHPPTNTHTMIPGTELKTPSLTSGQVLLIWGLVFAGPSGNTVQAALTIGGAENPINEPGASIEITLPIFYRASGLTGVQTLAVNGWASSSVGTINAVLGYQLVSG